MSEKLGYTRVEAEELAGYIGQCVAIQGIVYNIRHMSGFSFVFLRTKRSVVQCVHSPVSGFPAAALKENMSVIFYGEVASEERSRSGLELRLRGLEVLSVPSEEPPVVINKSTLKASLDTVLDYRPFTLRNERERAIFKLQEGICRGFREFLHRNRFTEIRSPKIVSGGAEGGADMFRLDYFGREAYLAQSPQFYKQMLVGVFERVFEIGPVYRAERHSTSRHLNEYTGVDLEMGFIESFTELMRLEERMLCETLAFLREEYAPELALRDVRLPSAEGIPIIRFTEAKALISETYDRPIIDEEDLDPEEERLLCELINKETHRDFVFVTHYLSSKRPFYALDSANDPTVTESFDLLFRGLEITTGGQRIHSYRDQVAKMKARGLDPACFESYLTAHKYGLPPHGGFGLGLERFTARLLELPNIRYATLFPRDIGRLEP
jgi:nondiscriminating aspartyl-tRNA synthetase